jgi:hypothetical protein
MKILLALLGIYFLCASFPLHSQTQLGVIAGAHYIHPYAKYNGHFIPKYRDGSGMSLSVMIKTPLQKKISLTSAVGYFKRSYRDFSSNGGLGAGIINDYRLTLSTLSIDAGLDFKLGGKNKYHAGFCLSLGYDIQRREDGIRTLWTLGMPQRIEPLSGPVPLHDRFNPRYFANAGVSIPIESNMDLIIDIAYSIGLTGTNTMSYSIQFGYLYSLASSDPEDPTISTTTMSFL